MIFNVVYGKPKYASIIVTYPSGGVCTCSDGSKVLTAPDTSGTVTFVVPHSGEWTLQVTKNGLTGTDTVNAAELGETYTKTLNIRYYLFKAGEGAKVTLTPHTERYHTSAGWAPDVTSTANYNSDRIYVRGNTGVVSETESHDVAGYVDSAAIDFTDYDTLCIDSLAYNSFTLYIRKNNSNVLTKSITTTTRGMTEVDITGLTGNHSIRVHADGISHAGTVYNAYLEV